MYGVMNNKDKTELEVDEEELAERTMLMVDGGRNVCLF
jgi:hypothetical protein